MSTAHEPTPGPVVDVAPRPASVRKNLRGGNEAAARAAANRVEVPVTASPDSKIAASAAKEWRHHQEEHGARPTTEAWQKITEIPDSSKAIDSIADVDAKNKAIAVNDALRNLMSANAEGLNQNLDATYVQIIQPLQEIMLQAPGFAELAKEMGDGAALTDDQKKEWVKFLTEQIDAGRATGDNRFADKLKEKYTEFIKKERKPTADTEAETRLKKQRDLIEKQQENAVNRFNLLESKANDNRLLKEDYKPDGPQDVELKKLEGKISGDAPAYEAAKGELKAAEDAVEVKEKALDAHRAGGGTMSRQAVGEAEEKLIELKKNVREAKGKLQPFEKDIKDRDGLIAQRDSLDDEYTKLLDNQAAATSDVETFRQQVNVLNAQISELGHGDTEDIAKGLQEIFKDSFTETMMARMAHDRDGVLDVLSTKIAAETDPHVKIILKQLRESANRWSSWESGRIKGKLGGQEKLVIDKDSVEHDMKILMEKGPEGLVNRMLESQINPDTIDAAHPLGMVYSRDQREELSKNKEFMDKVSGPAIAMLLKQAQAEGMLHPSDMAKIADTEWGESALDALAELNKNKSGWDEAKKQAGGFKKLLTNVNTRRGFAAILAIAFLPAVGLPVIGGFMLYKFLKPGEAPHDAHAPAASAHAPEKHAPPPPSISTAKAAA